MTQGRAGDAFEVEIVAPERKASRLRRLVVVVSNLLLEGSGPVSSGGRRAVVTERASRRRVAEFVEPIGDDGTSDFGRMLVDHESLDATAFRERWIDEAGSID